MGLGNGKYDNGNKGSNFDFELTALRILERIAAAIPAAACCPTDATEATLQQVLVALQSGQEYEQNLVIDQGGAGCPGNCPTYLQVRTWDTVTHTFNPPVYYNASGTLVVPVGPVVLVNPQYVLDNILTQVTAINADLDVALSTRASQVTVASILTTLNNIKLDTANLANINRTPTFTADTTSVIAIATPTGVISYSLLFLGTNGELNGAVVPDGYRVDYGNGKDLITGAMTYLRPTAGTGQQVLITTLT